MKCSKCQSEHNVKNGVIHGVQRYKYKECGSNFSVDYSQVVEKEEQKQVKYCGIK